MVFLRFKLTTAALTERFVSGKWMWTAKHSQRLDVKANESVRLHVRKDGRVVAMPYAMSFTGRI
ncbi:MAG TPA: hypothetical protein V6D22_13840 [Candidatus Obscuribacterales bacterium]